MCDKTYPVFRSGSILKSDHPLDPDQAVEVGRRLRDLREDLNRQLSTLFHSIADISGVGQEDIDAVRVRLLPAVTIDFPPIKFSWQGHEMDFRACFTVCPGTRKAKVWTRYNFKEAQDDKEIVALFYAWVGIINQQVHQTCMDFYNDQLEALKLKSRLSRTWSITIRLVSASNPAIKRELEGEFSQSARSGDSRNKAYDVLLNELERECGLRVNRKELGERTKLVGFRYPRKLDLELTDTLEEMSQSASNSHDAVEQLTTIASPPLANDSFEALCIVDYNQQGMEITGVAHEPSPPKDFRRSAPHVVSGEISFEVGNAY